MASSSIHKAINLPSTLEAFPKLSGFTILRTLHSSSVCTVYKARQDRLGRLVALKVLPEIPAPTDLALERFNRAAYAGAQVVHPNLPAFYEIGTQDGFHYAVLEYVHGWTLQDLLDRRKRLAEHRAVSVALQTAKALAALHGRGIVHRNLKPKNIMVGTDGHTRLAGLGLAKCDAICFSHRLDAKTIGTPHYMAPEMIRGHTTDPRSDLYALGVTLYTMATGHPPFERGIPAAVMAQHIYKHVPDVRSLRTDFSESYARLTEKLLVKDPGKRIQSAHEAVRWLEQLERRESDGASKEPLSLSGTLKNVAVFMSAMVLVLLFGLASIGIVYSFWPPYANMPEVPAQTQVEKPSNPQPRQTVQPRSRAPQKARQTFTFFESNEEYQRLHSMDGMFEADPQLGIETWKRFLQQFPDAKGIHRENARRSIQRFRKQLETLRNAQRPPPLRIDQLDGDEF